MTDQQSIIEYSLSIQEKFLEFCRLFSGFMNEIYQRQACSTYMYKYNLAGKYYQTNKINNHDQTKLKFLYKMSCRQSQNKFPMKQLCPNMLSHKENIKC